MWVEFVLFVICVLRMIFSFHYITEQGSASGRRLTQMSSLGVQSQNKMLVNPHISFDFRIADIGTFKKKIDMNNNRCSKAEKNDFEFDLLSV